MKFCVYRKGTRVFRETWKDHGEPLPEGSHGHRLHPAERRWWMVVWGGPVSSCRAQAPSLFVSVSGRECGRRLHPGLAGPLSELRSGTPAVSHAHAGGLPDPGPGCCRTRHTGTPHHQRTEAKTVRPLEKQILCQTPPALLSLNSTQKRQARPGSLPLAHTCRCLRLHVLELLSDGGDLLHTVLVRS